MPQTALAVSCAAKCTGENNRSTIDSIALAKVVRGRSSRETAQNADWQVPYSAHLPHVMFGYIDRPAM